MLRCIRLECRWVSVHVSVTAHSIVASLSQTGLTLHDSLQALH